MYYSIHNSNLSYNKSILALGLMIECNTFTTLPVRQ